MDAIIVEMIKNAMVVKEKAYSPYSKFKVGACIYTSKGEYFSGCNVENSAFGATLCAEAVALGKMISEGESLIKELLIISSSNQICPPCGICRQMIKEFSNDETIVHLCANDKLEQSLAISKLLPMAFNDSCFLPQGTETKKM